MTAAIPANESARLQMLRRYAILDTEPEAVFDRIASLTARLLNVPVATVTLVDAERQWHKAYVGTSDRGSLASCRSVRTRS